MENCDMCGTKIENNKCSCGTWTSPEEGRAHPFSKGLEHFHEMKRFTMTSDAPYLGAACVYFRGDYNDTKKVEKFLHEMKGRPYYDEEG